MTRKELKEFTRDHMVKRTDANIDALVLLALQAVHTDVQDLHQWRCMEAHATLNLAAGETSVAVPGDYKCARYLWLTTGGVKTPLYGDTEGGVKRYQVDAQYEPAAPVWGADQFRQRWWEEEREVRLAFASTQAETLQLDYYAYLPWPAAEGDTDWFLTRLWYELALGACGAASTSFWADKRHAAYQGEYLERIREKNLLDLQHKWRSGRVRRQPIGGKL